MRTVAFILLNCLAHNVAIAEADEQKVPDVPVQEAAEPLAAVTKKPEQADDFTIHRRINPDDPCDRGLDTYDYETSWYDETQVYV